MFPIIWKLTIAEEGKFKTEGWEQLREFPGGESVAGGKLKGTGRLHWLTPNAGATNETGFTSLPEAFYCLPLNYSNKQAPGSIRVKQMIVGQVYQGLN